MNTTKHPQRRKSGNPANRAAEERVAAERAAAGPAKSAASAVQTTKQPQRRKSLACRFGRHHWEPKRAKRAKPEGEGFRIRDPTLSGPFWRLWRFGGSPSPAQRLLSARGLCYAFALP